jgi:hypothetical protein
MPTVYLTSPVKWVILTIIVAALLILASVSVDWGDRRRVVNPSGQPLAGVFVAYLYRGFQYNVVQSSVYCRSGSIVLTDKNGEFHVEPTIHVHLPFPLETGPKLSYQLIYCPDLHNAYEVYRLTGTTEGSHEGWCLIDPQANTFVMYDLADNPERWYTSMELAFRALEYLTDGEYAGHDTLVCSHADEGLKKDIIRSFLADVELFRHRYGDSIRHLQPPRFWDSLPRHVQEQKTKRLEVKEPWSYYIERDWGEEINRLKQYSRAVKPQ